MVAARTLMDQVARAFNDAGDDYATTGAPFLPHFTELVLERAALRPGQRVVDLATGPGSLALSAVPMVGLEGEVVGVDISDVQLRIARRAAAKIDGPLRFVGADAVALDLGERTVDAALCGFGLPYLAEPVHLVREAARVLKPGGRFIGTVWAAPFLEPLGQRLQATLERMEAPLVHRPFGDDPAEVAQWLLRAEFEDVEVEEHTLEVTFPAFDDWWWLARAFAFLLRFDAVDDEKRQAILEAHHEELAALAEGLTMAVKVYLVQGRR